MVNPGDWGAYPSFWRDNTLNFGVIHQDAMLQPQPPRLLDPVKQTLRLKHFSLKTEKSYVHYIQAHCSRTFGTQGCEDDYGLNACFESGWKRSEESVGWVS